MQDVDCGMWGAGRDGGAGGGEGCKKGLGLFYIFGEDDDLLAINFSFDEFVVVRVESDVADGGAAFGGETAAFNVQVFDQDYAVAGAEFRAIAVDVFGGGFFTFAGGTGQGQGLFVDVKHVEEVLRPAFGAEAGEHAPSYDFYGGDFAPHAVVETTPMVGVGRLRIVNLATAGAAGQQTVVHRLVGGGCRGIYGQIIGRTTQLAAVLAAFF